MARLVPVIKVQCRRTTRDTVDPTLKYHYHNTFVSIPGICHSRTAKAFLEKETEQSQAYTLSYFEN